MTVDLLILSSDVIALTGLVAMVEQDECLRSTGRTISDPENAPFLDSLENRPQVVILGYPPTTMFVRQCVTRLFRSCDETGQHPRIVVVSRSADDDDIDSALRLGVSAYLTQITSAQDLLPILQIVAKGGVAFSPSVADRIFRYFASIQVRELTPRFTELTHRELQILELLARGLNNRQISRQLFLTEKTVRNYVSRILQKLRVHDRASAVIRARDAGIGGIGSVTIVPGP